jgi:CheY-like chemotaxis protein
MKKILIVEDDQLVANIYRNKFAVDGFKVEVAHDGQAGLEAVRAFCPDVVILDLMLPKLSGLDVMKAIRSRPDTQHLPVVVFSNTYLSNMIQEAWKAGATKCLSKANCTAKQVVELVRGILSPNDPASPAPPPPASPPTRAAADPDAEFQADIRQTFLQRLPSTLAALRSILQALVRSGDEAARVKQLNELYTRVRCLTGCAGIADMTRIAQMSDALEALLKDLLEKPKNINTSTLRTVASAIDFIGSLSDQSKLPAKSHFSPSRILVVDDEAISRRAITHALEKAKLKSVEIADSNAAFARLSEEHFDLIFLDVNMPGMDGFELCTKLRALPAYKKTPVVFVTSLNDLENRVSSSVSGGTDFIAKPFLFMELAVKALVYLFRARQTAG